MTRARAKAIIDAGLDELRVSYYGMKAETYEKVMVGLKFDVTMSNLLGFLELREELGSPHGTRHGGFGPPDSLGSKSSVGRPRPGVAPTGELGYPSHRSSGTL